METSSFGLFMLFQYWKLIRRKLSGCISPVAFNFHVLAIVGKENSKNGIMPSYKVHLHNSIIKGILCSSLLRLKIKELETRSLKRMEKKGETKLVESENSSVKEETPSLKSSVNPNCIIGVFLCNQQYSLSWSIAVHLLQSPINVTRTFSVCIQNFLHDVQDHCFTLRRYWLQMICILLLISSIHMYTV